MPLFIITKLARWDPPAHLEEISLVEILQSSNHSCKSDPQIQVLAETQCKATDKFNSHLHIEDCIEPSKF